MATKYFSCVYLGNKDKGNLQRFMIHKLELSGFTVTAITLDTKKKTVITYKSLEAFFKDWKPVYTP
jgi:hypothetical protein